MALAVTLKFGERVLVTLPDGRTGWIAVNHTPRKRKSAVLLCCELPRDVKLIREEIAYREEPLDQGEQLDAPVI